LEESRRKRKSWGETVREVKEGEKGGDKVRVRESN